MTLFALMLSCEVISLSSITVPAVVMVVGPLYGVSVVPSGTPALPANGSPNPQVVKELVQNSSVADDVPTTALIGEQPGVKLNSV